MWISAMVCVHHSKSPHPVTILVAAVVDMTCNIEPEVFIHYLTPCDCPICYEPNDLFLVLDLTIKIDIPIAPH